MTFYLKHEKLLYEFRKISGAAVHSPTNNTQLPRHRGTHGQRHLRRDRPPPLTSRARPPCRSKEGPLPLPRRLPHGRTVGELLERREEDDDRLRGRLDGAHRQARCGEAASEGLRCSRRHDGCGEGSRQPAPGHQPSAREF
jgi:hypothetical protein